MADPLTRPIQVFLDTQRLIQVQPTKPRGPKKDFFAGDNAGFQKHKAKIVKEIEQAGKELAGRGDPAGFVMVQMREEGLGKSYRPLGALFTAQHRFALIGGASIGQMYFQATPEALQELAALVQAKAEIEPRLVENEETGEFEERVTAYRSEVGAIEEVRLPIAADRLDFSARDAISWLETENVIGGYVVELFRPNVDVTPIAVTSMISRFRERLEELGGVIAVPFSDRSVEFSSPGLTLSVDLRVGGPSQIILPTLRQSSEGDDGSEVDVVDYGDTAPVRARIGVPDRTATRHQQLLDVLASEALVRRIELPLRLEASPATSNVDDAQAKIPAPVGSETYPVVGVVDAGVANVAQLSPWRAGGSGPITPGDRDEDHGTFIAGLLAGGPSLNPMLAASLEAVPCRHFDITVMPRRGMLSQYYETPDEFFDQLEAEVQRAKSESGVRIFNMSLGAPGIRKGLGYSSFAASLDRIALAHDVIFVVAAGNLRGLEARPEWPEAPEDALTMLATRAIAEERITAPGEHLYGLTVGALNPEGVFGVTPDVPTAYSRRGPGPGGARKPELAHYGGSLSRSGNTSGLYSITPTGAITDGSGTSYATPLTTASLATLDHRLEGRAARETLLALSVHKAQRPKILKAKPLRAVARDFVGFGVPVQAERALSDDPHSITLVFSDILPPRRELSFVFTWPRSLTSSTGKCRGRVDVTLAHTPPIDAAFDAECQRVQLQAQLYQLEEKINAKGEIIIDPQPMLNHCDSQLPEHLEYTERYLLESGLKWTPIKRYEKNMPRGCGSASEWRLSLKALTRAGAIFPQAGVRFSLLMTISDPSAAAPVYEEVRAEILRRGLRLADITVAQRVRSRGA
ncbi:hypothetical protein GCM10011321_28360 [Youhaiella tibetensis]|uniref:S8 family peptidase n=1 Tax=Paradevosia tibetensis TaxID=1447062 RepID=A0A5B9DIX1_9HYPH|nr:S8 family peptidase [Youhaiella tibetensis]QEE19170.1 S8 family peptidase [Youhaiella tibetensis]GGF35603.1 hypothetical protein GCM10011321_28360 [Youhaiella tibetensis]